MKARKIIGRLFAVMLAVLLVVSILPMSVFAATAKDVLLTETVGESSGHTPLSQSKYYKYSALSSTQKKTYDAILNAVKKGQNTVNLSSYKIDPQVAYDMFSLIIDEHPEYFYLERNISLSANSKTGKAEEMVLLFSDGKKVDTVDKNGKLKVNADKKVISKKIKELNAVTKEILSKIPKTAPLVIKEKMIHDSLADIITYDYSVLKLPSSADLTAYNDWNVYGAMVEGSAVCEGYAKSLSYLCRSVGIDAITISGVANAGNGTENHMWNAINLSGKWYLVDLTWDDHDSTVLPVSYMYFNVTSSKLSKDHAAFGGQKIPSCTATTYSYKSLCLNIENNKLPSNYKEIIDRVVKYKENGLTLYLGTDKKVSDKVLGELILNETSSVKKYIKSKKHKVKFSNSTISWAEYMTLELIHPCDPKDHKYKNSCDEDCNVCGEKRTVTHTKKTTVTKATTSKNGKTVTKCSKCGKTLSTATIKYAKTVKLSTTSYTYNGATKKPTVTVKDSAGKTISKSNYTVTYPKTSKSIGTYKVKVTFKGNYSGTKTLTFKINPVSVSKCSIKLSKTSYTYNGKTQKPTVTVKDSAGKTISKSYYTVTYPKTTKNVGTYKVTIKMKGSYSGTKTLTYKIDPPKSSVSKITAGKKALTVSVAKKSTQVSGYQIQYSTSKKFTSAKTKTISSYKTTKATISSLKAKTTYYVRVRTYKTVGKTKIYSAWSSAKSMKTK